MSRLNEIRERGYATPDETEYLVGLVERLGAVAKWAGEGDRESLDMGGNYTVPAICMEGMAEALEELNAYRRAQEWWWGK